MIALLIWMLRVRVGAFKSLFTSRTVVFFLAVVLDQQVKVLRNKRFFFS